MQSTAHLPFLNREFDSGTLQSLRAAVQAHARRFGLPEQRASEVVLALHELAANAIAHGGGRGRLRMWDLTDALSCEVTDSGSAQAGRPAVSDPPKAAGPWAVTDPWPVERGHGLWLVRQVVDQMDLRSGPRGSRAVVTFALPARAGQ